jgi:3-hydroxyisobutyrate dehydrogenase-like beta-hydroxyacid dehydrogenase
MRKNLAIALEEAQRIGAALPVTRLVARFYAEVQAAGGGTLGHIEPDHPPIPISGGSGPCVRPERRIA